ncbi:MAG TPA: hypothetical protein VGP07_07330 [Polyangia bacterium]
MSDQNGNKTREQLLGEIEALKQELERRDDKPAASAPIFAAPLTRRESLVSWVAPVILSLPVVTGVGMVLKPGIAHAVTRAPTSSRPSPTLRATTAPTATATATAAPTVAPTRAGQCIVPPPSAGSPTASPTLGMGAAPDSRPSNMGYVPLGSARAASRRHLAL